MGIAPFHFTVGTRDGDFFFFMHLFLIKVNLALATNALKLRARQPEAFLVPFFFMASNLRHLLATQSLLEVPAGEGDQQPKLSRSSRERLLL